MIKEWLAEYNPANKEEALHALREIMQEIALAGLQRAGFLRKQPFMRELRSVYFMDWIASRKTWIFHCWK